MGVYLGERCEGSGVYIPTTGCDSCGNLQRRVEDLEDALADVETTLGKTVTISKTDVNGNTATLTLLGEVG